MLVIVKDGDLESFTQLALYIKALGRLDILQIDATEGRLHCRDDFYQPVRIVFIQLDVKAVDASEFLEQYCLALHDRLGAQRADGP